MTIRSTRDAAKLLTSQGADPSEQKRLAKLGAQETVNFTLEAAKRAAIENLKVIDLYTAWLDDGVRRQDGNAEIIRSFNADVLPYIGNLAIREITEHDIRAVLKRLVNRGINRSAVVINNNLGQMFSWANKRTPWRGLMIDGNPLDLIEIKKIVAPEYDLRNERSRILSDYEIRELEHRIRISNDRFNSAPDKRVAARPISPQMQIAIWLMLSTLCRVGELSMASWTDINFDTGEWLIPRKNVKNQTGDHRIFLSDYSLGKFRELYKITGVSKWCFPATLKNDSHICVKSISKQISDRQCIFKQKDKRFALKNRSKDENALVLSKGENGNWTPHDLRRTGATIMQRLGISLDVIDRCQNHVLAGSKVRRHYLHHPYSEEKKMAWQALGKLLESLADLNHPGLECIEELGPSLQSQQSALDMQIA